jgi:uroporphyrinogen III methyltransferase/synthase
MGREKVKRFFGTVYLVGAGPGDPELITRKGARLLQRADCVIYDRLLNRALLKLTKRNCETIYAGKGPTAQGEGQARINQLLIKKTRQYRCVVRLKGGDPTLFGRVTEEMEALRNAGIDYEIVPGVSSPWAAAAAVGIPLTDRQYSSSVAFVTGHQAAWKRPSVKWNALAIGADTLVVLMGRAALSDIVRRLIRAGRPGKTPIALIRWASMPEQEILISRLGTIEAELKERPEFSSPVIAIIGEVVSLAERFGAKKKKVLVTRDSNDQNGLKERLKAAGLQPVLLPMVTIKPVRKKRSEILEFTQKLPEYDWVLFNSHYGVESLDRLVRSAGQRLPRLVRGKIAAIGPRTLASVKAAGLKAQLVPAESSTDGLQKALKKFSLKRKKILIPRSNLGAGDSFARWLRQAGAQLNEWIVYETVETPVAPAALKKALKNLDAATFTSASTARGFLWSLKKAKMSPAQVASRVTMVAIGPATAAELKRGGIKQVMLPKNKEWQLDGLIDAIKRIP